MKKLVLLPALTLLMTIGIFTLGQQSKAAHAQTVPQTQVQSQITNGKPDTTPEVKGKESVGQETPEGAEAKQTENDGPGGHQDPQGTNVNHQFDGVE